MESERRLKLTEEAVLEDLWKAYNNSLVKNVKGGAEIEDPRMYQKEHSVVG